MLNNVALGQVDLQVLLFSRVSVIPTTIHSHSFINNRRHIALAIDRVDNYASGRERSNFICGKFDGGKSNSVFWVSGAE